MIEQLPVGFAILDAVRTSEDAAFDFVITEANAALCNFIGREHMDIIGKSLELVYPAAKVQAGQLLAMLNKVVTTGEMEIFSMQIKKTGNWYKISIYSFQPLSLVVLFSDITAQISSLADLDAFFEITPDLMNISTLDGRIIRVNPAWEKEMGYAKDELVGHFSREFVHPDDVAANLTIAKQLESNSQTLNFVNRYRHRDGTYHSLAWDSKSDGQKIYSVARDITAFIEKQKQIEYLSYHDVLTGLYNRRFLEEEIQRLDQPRNLPISIIMGDLNQLKLINDAFGHEKGDELIRKAAQAMVNGCRADDLIARWGGDEFLICLPRTSPADAETIVGRIRDNCEKESVNTIVVSVSFGVGTKLAADEPIIGTIRSAEDAMYINKAAERKNNRGDVLDTIRGTLFERDPVEEIHANLVSSLCHDTAEALGFSPEETRRITLAGLIHDIGKIAIRHEILAKPGSLTEEEKTQVRQHVEIGYRVVSALQDMLDVGKAILSHHERVDGFGYPNGAKWTEIPLSARIIALAEAYTTMTSENTYKRRLSQAEAIAEIRRNSGVQFDPAVVEVFIEKVILKREQP